MERVLNRAARLSILGLCLLSFGTRFEDGIAIDLAKPVRSNLPGPSASFSPAGLTFKSSEPCPSGESCFYVRYEIPILEAGPYRISIKGPGSGARGYSRYSLAIDDSPPLPVLLRRRVGDPRADWQDQGPFSLGAGKHVLEFRFFPEQRMRNLSRVNEPVVGHHVRIEGVRLDPVSPEAKEATPPLDREFRLHPGDQVVLFGDSITEEGFYGRHLARILRSAGAKIELFNSGVSLNRTWEALERLELDVLALRPEWVVLAFGVNDAVHMAPDEFRKSYAELVRRLRKEKIQVLCATPTGMSPDPDGEGNYFHTPDRSRAFDRTMAMEAGIVQEIALASGALVADVFGTFTRAGIARRSLMGSQWHPGDEGGRVYALTLLRALGLQKEELLRTGDPRDAAIYAAVSALPRQEYPEYAPKAIKAPMAPDGGPWIAATSFTENTVSAFSKSSGQLVGRVPVGHHPMGIAYSGKRQELYVACEGSGRLDVIRLPEFALEGSISLGDVYPVSIALSEDERTAWVGTFFGGSVIQVDLARRQATRTISVGSLVEGVAVAAGGRLVLATARDKGIVFIDGALGKIQTTIRATRYAASFYRTRDGKLYAIDTAAWTLSPLDLEHRDVQPPLAAPFESRALVLDPQTDDLWAGDWKNGRIVRITPVDVTAFAELPFSFGIAVIPVAGR